MAVAFEELSPDQVAAVEEADRWFKSRDTRALRIFGSAGTGKSTVVEHILARLNVTTQVMAPTNRAVKVLRGKGVATAKTIQKVLFLPTEWCYTEGHAQDDRCEKAEKEGKVKHEHSVRFFKQKEPPPGVRCFVVDEASMVGADTAADVDMFGVKTLVVGDPYQLPPVGDKPGYTYDLPGVELQYSHRFDSESDIAYIANKIRMSTGIKEWYDLLPYVSFDEWDNYDLILAWRNATRWQIINMIRTLRGRSLDEPQIGDRLISVANTYNAGVYNGDELTVCGPLKQAVHQGAWQIPTEEAGLVTAWKVGFRNFEGEQEAAKLGRMRGTSICALTWSECMTAHKAQGGEWPNVMVVDDFGAMSRIPTMTAKDINTWAYTAATRASRKVDFVRVSDLPTGMRLRKMMSAAGV